MKYYLAYIVSIFLMTACSSSEEEPESGDRLPAGTKISFTLTADVSVPKSVETKWGVVDEYGDPPAVYNADEVYFVVQTANNSGTYHYLKMDMTKNGNKVSVSMQIMLTVSNTNRLDITSSYGALSLDLSDGDTRNYFFSSKGVESVSLAVDPNTRTPAGQTVYQPYGDLLYRTVDSNSSIQSMFAGFLLFGGTLIRGGDLSTLDIACNMSRCTGVFSAKMIVVDDNNHRQPTGDYFNQAMGGNYADWKVRAFISDYPLYYNLVNNSMVEDSNKGIVNLFDGWENIKTEVSATLNQAGGTTTTFEGCGIHDASYPYIYQGDLNGKQLCLSVQSPEGVTKTLRVDLATVLTSNVNLTGTVVVYLSDLQEAFSGLRSSVDNEVLDIPYKFFYE